MIKTLRTERKTVAAFSAALAVLCVISIISAEYIRSMLRSWEGVDHTHLVLSHISVLQQDLYGLTDSARNFAAAPSDATYEGFTAACDEVRHAVATLQELTIDNDVQVKRLAAFLQRFNAEVESTRRDSDPKELRNRWAGMPLRPVFRMTFELNKEESRLLSLRDEATRQTGHVALLTVGIGGGVAALLIVTFGFIIIRDLRGRRIAEAELRRARVEAVNANTAKSSFLANMSHELRTPLTAILGYADLLMTAPADLQERDRYLITMRRSGEHLLAIINDILDLSKIEAGRMQIETTECQLVDVLADVDSFMRTRATCKGIDFSIDYASAIPDRVRTDPTRLRQMLVNLAGNAIKFTEEGSVRLVIRYDLPAGPSSSAPDGPTSMLVVDVIDTGIGMTPAQQQAVFEPFMQGDVTTTRRYGGTGLGLSISRRLAMVMGGRLEVTSEPNRGSTFRLQLPILSSAGATMIPPGEIAPRLAANTMVVPLPSALSMRVLLAEDGAENREVITLHLQRAGCDVTPAEDGQVACTLIQEAAAQGRPFDVVLMDMQMPVMDGYTATRELRARGYSGRIIALTANAMKEDRDRCLQAGCDEYAAKPVDVPQLLLLMQNTLASGTAPDPSSPASVISTLLADPVFRNLTAKFCDTLGPSLDGLRAHLASGNLPALAAAVHKLAGAGGSYGFDDITREAKALERLAKANAASDALEQQLNRLSTACDAARDLIATAA